MHNIAYDGLDHGDGFGDLGLLIALRPSPFLS